MGQNNKQEIDTLLSLVRGFYRVRCIQLLQITDNTSTVLTTDFLSRSPWSAIIAKYTSLVHNSNFLLLANLTQEHNKYIMQEEISCQDASFIFDMYSMISQNNRLR
jgi:hypothetical protein